MGEKWQDRGPARRPLRPSRLNADYARLLAALQQTPRGRWFLSEFARRNRSADTELVLHAILRLEETIQVQRTAAPTAPTEQTPRAAIDAAAFDLTLREANDTPASLREANISTRARLIESAELIADATWQMRERGYSESLRSTVERGASDILAACAAKAMAAGRIAGISRSLDGLLLRLKAELATPARFDTNAPPELEAPAEIEDSEPEPFTDDLRQPAHVPDAPRYSPAVEERLAQLAASIEAGMAALADSGPAPAPDASEIIEPAVSADAASLSGLDGAETPERVQKDMQELAEAEALIRLNAAQRAALFG